MFSGSSSKLGPYSHKIASGMPSLPLRYNCVGTSHFWRPDTASDCAKVNDPVNAINGSSKKLLLSFSLSPFLISSSKALLVSIPGTVCLITPNQNH